MVKTFLVVYYIYLLLPAHWCNIGKRNPKRCITWYKEREEKILTSHLRLDAVPPPASRRSGELPDRPLTDLSWEQSGCVSTGDPRACCFVCFQLPEPLGDMLIIWFSSAQAVGLFAACRQISSPVLTSYREVIIVFVCFLICPLSFQQTVQGRCAADQPFLKVQESFHIPRCVSLHWRLQANSVWNATSWIIGRDEAECVNHFPASCCSGEQWIWWKEAGSGLSLQPQGPTPQPLADGPSLQHTWFSISQSGFSLETIHHLHRTSVLCGAIEQTYRGNTQRWAFRWAFLSFITGFDIRPKKSFDFLKKKKALTQSLDRDQNESISFN